MGILAVAGRPLAARLSVASSDGRAYAPDDAWRHADEAFDRADRAFEYGYFHAAGTAELTVPTGALRVAAWHGPEYRVARAALTIRAGRTGAQGLVAERLANLPARGWRGGGSVMHLDCAGACRRSSSHPSLPTTTAGREPSDSPHVHEE